MSLKMKMAVIALTVPFMLAGCGNNEADIKKEQERNATMGAWQEKRLDIPGELYNYRMPNGSYEITVNIDGEEQDCLANVISTHSHGKQVILTNCHTPN